MTSIMPGVVDQGTELITITATLPSGNVCVVDLDPATGTPRITLNGVSHTFPAGYVFWGLNYFGAALGGDTFALTVPNTNCTVIVAGGNNTVHGGSAWSTVHLSGGTNSFDCPAAGAAYVFSTGPNDAVIKSPLVNVIPVTPPIPFG